MAWSPWKGRVVRSSKGLSDDVAALLFDVIEQLGQDIQVGRYPAIVKLEGERTVTLIDYDYQCDPAMADAFERRAADHAYRVSAIRWVFAVPQVWVINERDVAVREVSGHRLRDGEHEAITWMALDRDQGLDFGRVHYRRRPSGEPILDEPEVFTVPMRIGPMMPGYTLLQILTGDESGND